MLSKYIQPGQKVDLHDVNHSRKPDGTYEQKKYTSQVVDLSGEERIEVLMPIEQTKLILLPVDGVFDLFFYTENGLYECFAKVVDRYKTNNIYVVVFEPTSNLRKHQRREFYRFNCAIELGTRLLEPEELKDLEMRPKELEFIEELSLSRGIIVDISGGGMRFVVGRKFELGSLLYCRYSIEIEEKAKEYEVIVRVLHVNELPAREGEFEHRVQYVNLNNVEREEIIRYIFEEERKHRKREKYV